jgi:GntR family uxuAB operon transcriptional repressor
MWYKIGMSRMPRRAVEAIKDNAPADVMLPLVSNRSSTGIAAQLRRAITDGLYAYGDRLPAEREIARSFGASRTTVRNALRLLEERNFVRRKVGSGTFVVHSSGHDEREIADITSPLELMDVRLAVEPHIVRLAVLHGTARDIEAMAEALSELEQAGADRDRFTHWDQCFHMALANATHNPLMVWTYRQINEVRSHTQWNKVKDKVLTPARIADYNAEHRALFEAMQARDGEAAVGIINRHLAEARHDLVGVQAS